MPSRLKTGKGGTLDRQVSVRCHELGAEYVECRSIPMFESLLNSSTLRPTKPLYIRGLVACMVGELSCFANLLHRSDWYWISSWRARSPGGLHSFRAHYRNQCTAQVILAINWKRSIPQAAVSNNGPSMEVNLWVLRDVIRANERPHSGVPHQPHNSSLWVVQDCRCSAFSQMQLSRPSSCTGNQKKWDWYSAGRMVFAL